MSASTEHTPRVIVVSLSKDRRGGVAAVLSTLAEAGFFSDRVIYHYSCGDGGQARKLYSALRQWLGFVQAIRRHKPDLIHIHFSSDMSFWRKVPYIYWARLCGIKLLLQVHPSHFSDYLQKQKSGVRKFILAVLKQADAIAFANSGMVDFFQPLLPRQRLYYIENPVNLTHYSFQRGPRKEQALFLGAILKGKGVYDIVRAAPLVIGRHPFFKFILCGDHELDKLQRLIVQQGLANHFELRSWIGYETKVQLLSESAMLLLPSYSEGFPMVVLEAMASGLPVITTPVGGMAKALTDGVQVLFAPPRQANQLADKILYLLDHPDVKDALATRALQYVQQHDVGAVVDRIQHIYRQMTDNESALKD
jgi:glycosyltransferase involved in cell wall biosynthesis